MKKEYLVLFGVVAVVVVFGGRAVSTYKNYKQRGIRNNNAGNLVITNIQWLGKIPKEKNTDGKFEQFERPEYGIRAMFMDIRNDIKKGLNTPRKLISTYAPPHENNTKAYMDAVAKALGKKADDAISVNDYTKLVKAIIQHENGVQPYPDSLISKAIQMAG